MPANADSVVVELIAKNDQFNADVRQSSAIYQKSMSDIETAAGGAEKAHGRMTLAMNNNRIALLEFQHVVRGSSEQLAQGVPLTQILAQHMSMLGEAVTLAGGTFGKLGAFLSGPWGIALTVAVGAAAMLISKHKEHADTLDDLVRKLQEHHDKTVLSQQADDIWAHSIDGVIDSEKKLADAMENRLKIQSVADKQAFASAQAIVALRAAQVAQAETKYDVGDPRLVKVQQAFHQAVRDMMDDINQQGEYEGGVISDLTKRSQDWADAQTDIVRRLQGYHPELGAFSADINAAFDAMKKAVSDAASANVPFDSVTRQVDVLNNRLAQSPQFIKEYIAQLRQLAAQLESTADAAKNVPKAISDFKSGLAGAEGTGPNRMGSSAAGFGQFMPATFEHYFRQAYPYQSGLSNQAIDDLRNNKQVAEGVINVATDDYVKILQRAGQQITAAALYTMHMLSAGDPKGTVALRLLNAPAGASARSIVGDRAVAQNGNIFTGTAGDARRAIARRIGDSSSAVSTGAIAIQQSLDKLQEQMDERLAASLEKEKDISVVKSDQQRIASQMIRDQDEMTRRTAEQAEEEKLLKKHLEEVAAQLDEARRFGGALVDDVLNPDNWTSWGNVAKSVLHDIMSELIQIAAINPLKNLINGNNALPTLSGVLGSLFGSGFDSTAFNLAGQADAAYLGLPSNFFASGHAEGGYISGAGSGTSDSIPARLSNGEYVLSAAAVKRIGVSTLDAMNDGHARHFAQGGFVRPSNAMAASPMGALGSGFVLVQIEASDYFDGRVMQVTGPVIAQAAIASTNGGAALSRRNLSREAQHRLE
jgi:hypothetical protein